MALKFESKNKPKTGVDMVPMIDIVFQLIIFFMVATTVKTTQGMELNLPKTIIPSEVSIRPLSVSIVNKNEILVDKTTTNLTDLPEVLKLLAPLQEVEPSVILYGDQQVSYQLLVEVMDVLRLAGYEEVDLALEPRK
jgi:biopolymer transport protein ExbD